MTGVELSRPVRNDTIGTSPRLVEVRADEAERKALARRFGLEAVDRLEAEVSVVRTQADIVASGRMLAEVTQTCVVTGEPVPARLEESFAVHFRPEPEAGAAQEEIELDEEEMDVIFHDGAMVDVGEAVAQTLALNLDPYPRTPAAAEVLKSAGVRDEAEAEAQAHPFGGLAALKDKLGGS